MAGTVPTITPGSITGMKGNDRRPVFFLKLHHSPQWNLVVKIEKVAGGDKAVSIHWSSKLMKNVQHPLVDTKIMTRAEFDIFQQFAKATFPMGSQQRYFADMSFTDGTWVKMPMVLNLTDADFVEKPSDSLMKIKMNVSKFSDAEVWHELGKVVAVDIFNGNYDRFDIDTGAWVNKGNVMFVTGGPTKVIGLDTFDTSPESRSNLTRPGGFDALRKLTAPGARREFALACVRSAGQQMQEALRGMGVSYFTMIVESPEGQRLMRIDVDKMANFFEGCAPAFDEGIAAGAEGLKRYLRSKIQQYEAYNAAPPSWQAAMGGPGRRPGGPLLGQQRRAGLAPPRAGKTIPQGILDRMAFLRWL